MQRRNGLLSPPDPTIRMHWITKKQMKTAYKPTSSAEKCMLLRSSPFVISKRMLASTEPWV